MSQDSRTYLFGAFVSTRRIAPCTRAMRIPILLQPSKRRRAALHRRRKRSRSTSSKHVRACDQRVPGSRRREPASQASGHRLHIFELLMPCPHRPPRQCPDSHFRPSQSTGASDLQTACGGPLLGRSRPISDSVRATLCSGPFELTRPPSRAGIRYGIVDQNCGREMLRRVLMQRFHGRHRSS